MGAGIEEVDCLVGDAGTQIRGFFPLLLEDNHFGRRPAERRA